MKEITTSEFDDIINTHKFVVVKYGATWCNACGELQSKLDEAESLTDIPFYSVDVDESPELKSRARIKAIPMTMFYRDGKVSSFIYGDTTVDKIQQKLRILTA